MSSAIATEIVDERSLDRTLHLIGTVTTDVRLEERGFGWIAVIADAPATSAFRMEPGVHAFMKAEARLPSEDIFVTSDGSVESVEEADLRTVKIRCLLKNTNPPLKGGELAALTIQLPHRISLAIPQRAIVYLHDADPVVFVRLAGATDEPPIYERRSVSIREEWTRDGYVEVRAGLVKGESIVVEGAILLTALRPN